MRLAKCSLIMMLVGCAGICRGQEVSPEAVPASVGIIATQAMDGTNKVYSVENRAASVLIAYSYRGVCTAKRLTYVGHADSALDYAEPLSIGTSEAVATADPNCEFTVTSAVFEDGSAYGDPTELAALRRRRDYALKELKYFAQTIFAESNSASGIMPDFLLTEIASKRSEIPAYRQSDEEEIFTRAEVLAHLENRTKFLRDHLSQDEEGKKHDFFIYRSLLDSWLHALSDKAYPKHRVHLVIGRKM